MSGSYGPKDFQAEFGVSRETMSDLQAYAALLEKWNSRINLVSQSTLPELWRRHMSDSGQVFSLAGAVGLWVDIGSGAGFPGLVAAVMAKNTYPEMRFVLVESDARKAAFLTTVIRETGANAEVKIARIEELPPAGADILSARALAPMGKLLEYAERHRKQGGICLFPKGAQAESELTAARENWHIEAEAIPSVTDSQAVIYRIGAFARV